jgi:hypothetical protein
MRNQQLHPQVVCCNSTPSLAHCCALLPASQPLGRQPLLTLQQTASGWPAAVRCALGCRTAHQAGSTPHTSCQQHLEFTAASSCRASEGIKSQRASIKGCAVLLWSTNGCTKVALSVLRQVPHGRVAAAPGSKACRIPYAMAWHMQICHACACLQCYPPTCKFTKQTLFSNTMHCTHLTPLSRLPVPAGTQAQSAAATTRGALPASPTHQQCHQQHLLPTAHQPHHCCCCSG